MYSHRSFVDELLYCPVRRTVCRSLSNMARDFLKLMFGNSVGFDSSLRTTMNQAACVVNLSMHTSSGTER